MTYNERLALGHKLFFGIYDPEYDSWLTPRFTWETDPKRRMRFESRALANRAANELFKACEPREFWVIPKQPTTKTVATKFKIGDGVWILAATNPYKSVRIAGVDSNSEANRYKLEYTHPSGETTEGGFCWSDAELEHYDWSRHNTGGK
jgi:hypothetical protein